MNFILARAERPLLKRMAIEVARLSQRFDKGISIQRTLLDHEDAATVAAAMMQGPYDAVIVDAPDHPVIHQAIRDLSHRECPVVTLISDIPGSTRLAHAQRLRGFGEQLAADGQRVDLAEIVRGGDDPLLSAAKLKDAFRRHPQTVGIYNAGGANRGVIAAMEEGVLSRRPLLIGHELTGFTYRCLKDGLMTLTIDQSPERQAQYAMEVVMHHFGFEGAVHAVPPYVSDAPFVLYGPQNLPTASPA